MSRPLEQIQSEYQQQAAIIGHTQYQIRALQSDLGAMFRHMRELNKEAKKAVAKQPSAPEVAPVVAEEVANEQT